MIPILEQYAASPSDSLAAALPEDAPAVLHTALLEVLYADRGRALQFLNAAQLLAQFRGDPNSAAWAARMQGHVHHTAGEHEKAVAEYEAAVSQFESEHQPREVARTLMSGLQALIYRGEYDRALQWAARASEIFHEHSDTLRLARLDSNVGNIYFRRDDPKTARDRYLRALEGFEVEGEPRDIAAALSNLAVCHIALGLFNDALDYYRRALAHCELHGLQNLAARANYNLAYLHYLRGDYMEARRLYAVSREHCRRTGDAYHAALCDLDEAEMSLELNLTTEGAALARSALRQFTALAMPYEQAKSLVNLAVAAGQRHDFALADSKLVRARRLFANEKNIIWTALVDQLRAVAAFRQARFDRAHRLGQAAWKVLSDNAIPRAAHCQILLARLWLKEGHADRARALAREALDHGGAGLSPSLRFHANLVQGEVFEKRGQWANALAAYEAARRDVEDLRTRLDSEDLRISLLSDKLAVYEALVSLYLDSPLGTGTRAPEQALALVQQAKSRTLVDQLSASSGIEAESPEFLATRQDLNSLYRQIEISSLIDHSVGGGRAAPLRQRASQLEAQLTRIHHPAVPASDATTEICSRLHPTELLIEYYEVRGVLFAFLISQAGVQPMKIGPSAPVLHSYKLLQFQLGRRRDPRLAADPALFHFQQLYSLLIAPIEAHLAPFRHLIFAPHRQLHGLAFSALHDGIRPLIDRFTLSVTPSAAAFAAGRARPVPAAHGALVMASPDANAPQIEDEARLVASLLPDAELLLGPQASVDGFRARTPGRRILHLAAHGLHRSDNPAFSALQLSNGRLSMFDLRRMRLDLDLVTLSACHTGSTVIVAGDELLGLMRGFLQAGARSLLVALWAIDDASTRAFMERFYRHFAEGKTLADAARSATLELRKHYPHPYYWAPFLVVGEPQLKLAR